MEIGFWQMMKKRAGWLCALLLSEMLMASAMLGFVGIVRISLWQYLGFYDYGEHWMLIALTVGAALVGVVMFGSLTGSMLPFILQRIGFDPAALRHHLSRPWSTLRDW
jgi:magnesium transporter